MKPPRSAHAAAAVVHVIDRLAEHHRRSPATVGRWITGDGTFYRRLAAGGAVRAKRYGEVLQWCSDHWPEDLLWPSDIPRPEPSVDNPTAPAPLTRLERRQAVLDARRRMSDAIDVSDWESAKAHERSMFEAALALRDDGTIADPEALCTALHIPRYVYDYVISRYANRPGVQPRPATTPTIKMHQALRAAGDVRFQASAVPPGAAAALATLAL